MRNLFIVFLIGICANNSFAYYQTKQGRWLSRDPINEKGFITATKHKSQITKRQSLQMQTPWGSDSVVGENQQTVLHKASKSSPNLYCYVLNSPLDLYDPFGLKVQICIRPVDRKFPPPSWWLIVHAFLKTDKCGNWGYFPKDGPNKKVPKEGGVVPEPYPNGSSGQIPKCKTVDCPCLDEQKLCDAISKSKSSGSWDGDDWKRVRHNCAHWTDMILKGQGCKDMEEHFPGYWLPSPNPKY